MLWIAGRAIHEGMARAKKRKPPRQRPDSWIGPWLRVHREAADVSLTSIAQTLKCEPSRVCRIESGETQFTAEELPIILAAYGVTVAAFDVRAREAAAVAA